MLGVGYNGVTEIEQFTEFSIKDKTGKHLNPVSAVCCNKFTLYLVTKSDGNRHDLVYIDNEINDGTPVFIDVKGEDPMALFGGFSHTAAKNYIFHLSI